MLQGLGTGCGHIDGKALFLKPFAERIAYYEFVIDDQDMKLPAFLFRQMNRPRRAGLNTGATARAGGKINHIWIGNGVRNRQVDGLARAKAGIKIIRDFHRTDVHTITASGASLRIDPVRMLLERYLILTGLACDGGKLRG